MTLRNRDYRGKLEPIRNPIMVNRLYKKGKLAEL